MYTFYYMWCFCLLSSYFLYTFRYMCCWKVIAMGQEGIAQVHVCIHDNKVDVIAPPLMPWHWHSWKASSENSCVVSGVICHAVTVCHSDILVFGSHYTTPSYVLPHTCEYPTCTKQVSGQDPLLAWVHKSLVPIGDISATSVSYKALDIQTDIRITKFHKNSCCCILCCRRTLGFEIRYTCLCCNYYYTWP